jgi:hypothetical protein
MLQPGVLQQAWNLPHHSLTHQNFLRPRPEYSQLLDAPFGFGLLLPYQQDGEHHLHLETSHGLHSTVQYQQRGEQNSPQMSAHSLVVARSCHPLPYSAHRSTVFAKHTVEGLRSELLTVYMTLQAH